MLHGMKQKFDLYFDGALSVTNQVLNNSKAAPVAASGLLSISLADVDIAIGIIGGLFALVVGAASLWVMIEKRTHDKRRRKEGEAARKKDAELTRLKIQKLKLENSALESHIKKR
jgi:hypothetical protein